MNPEDGRMAYQMRLDGKDDFDIAEVLGCTVEEAGKLASGHSDDIPSVSSTEARRDEVRYWDRWTGRLESEYRDGKVSVDKAIGAAKTISEARCKLLGLTAPSRAELEAALNAPPPASVDAELQQLADELGFGGRH